MPRLSVELCLLSDANGQQEGRAKFCERSLRAGSQRGKSLGPRVKVTNYDEINGRKRDYGHPNYSCVHKEWTTN